MAQTLGLLRNRPPPGGEKAVTTAAGGTGRSPDEATSRAGRSRHCPTRPPASHSTSVLSYSICEVGEQGPPHRWGWRVHKVTHVPGFLLV